MDEGKIVPDVLKLVTFYSDPSNWSVEYIPGREEQKVDMDTLMLLMIPTGLVEWLLATPRIQ